jgi:hypothetical protein
MAKRNKALRSARKPDGERAPFRLQQRDLDIIQLVNDCRILKSEQIASVFFKNPKTADNRLRKLFDYELLERHFITQVDLAPASSPIIYSLGGLGAEALATNYGLERSQLNFASKGLFNPNVLYHLLDVNDFRTTLLAAINRQEGIRLVRWVDEFAFRAKPDFVYLSSGRGSEQKKPVYPDGYFHLKTTLGDAHFFVEIDRGTEGQGQFKGQIDVYQEYIRSGGYQARFATTSLRILVVGKSDRRVENLKRSIRRAAGGDRYLLTTSDQMTAEALLTMPIWSRAESNEVVALIPAR